MSFQSRHQHFDQPDQFLTTAHPRPSLGQRIAFTLALWRQRTEMRRRLAELDSRSLRGIGISPAAPTDVSSSGVGGLRMTPPHLDRKSALFLDFDGTLVEIAATPEQVGVPPGLPDLLLQLYRQLGGALAIVSGRPLAQTDLLLRPFSASGAGEHGVSLRYDDGTLEEMPVGLAVPQSWRATLESAAEHWPGVRVEEKPHGVTVHVRLAPERGNQGWRLVRALVPSDHPWFR